MATTNMLARTLSGADSLLRRGHRSAGGHPGTHDVEADPLHVRGVDAAAHRVVVGHVAAVSHVLALRRVEVEMPTPEGEGKVGWPLDAVHGHRRLRRTVGLVDLRDHHGVGREEAEEP